jgi:hypothetical protein
MKDPVEEVIIDNELAETLLSRLNIIKMKKWARRNEKRIRNCNQMKGKEEDKQEFLKENRIQNTFL